MPTLATLDWIVIGLYFLVIFGIAYWAYLQERKGEETSADYFLAGRNVGWFVVGASLFASNIGSEHLIGLAGTGANSGVAVGQFEIMASLVLLLLGWVFVPFYIKSGVFTMPEFLERRYSSAARWYLSIISIIGYVLTKISVTIYAGGIVFETLMGISFWTGAIFVVVATGIYTIFGGLRAVLYTDLIQAIVLIAGAVMVTLLGLSELGGWGALQSSVAPSFFDLWKPTTDPDFPWTGILFGAPILGVWYWCTDQFIVQRTLSAVNEDHARRGSIFAGFLKLLPLFIFVIPGVIAYALSQQGALTLEQSDQALPALIGTLLPVGVRGIVVAGLMAALMSSLSSVFNSCSTLITWDIYRELKPDASERQLVWVGRLSTGVLVVLGLLDGEQPLDRARDLGLRGCGEHREPARACCRGSARGIRDSEAGRDPDRTTGVGLGQWRELDRELSAGRGMDPGRLQRILGDLTATCEEEGPGGDVVEVGRQPLLDDAVALALLAYPVLDGNAN